MTTEKTLSQQWEILTQKLKEDFSLPMQLDIDRILYLIGLLQGGQNQPYSYSHLLRTSSFWILLFGVQRQGRLAFL